MPTEHKHEYKFVHLINASPLTFTRDMLLLADEHGIAEGNADERLLRLKHKLENYRQNYLLLIDGADDETIYGELNKYLPINSKCLLLTTQRSEHPKNLGFKLLDLRPMEPKEAKQYLLDEIPRPDSPEEALMLAKELGYLPLALKHAAAYIRASNGCDTIASYLPSIPKL